MITAATIVSMHMHGSSVVHSLATASLWPGQEIRVEPYERVWPVIQNDDVVLPQIWARIHVLHPTALPDEEVMQKGKEIIIDVVWPLKGLPWGRWCPKAEWDVAVAQLEEIRRQRQLQADHAQMEIGRLEAQARIDRENDPPTIEAALECGWRIKTDNGGRQVIVARQVEGKLVTKTMYRPKLPKAQPDKFGTRLEISTLRR